MVVKDGFLPVTGWVPLFEEPSEGKRDVDVGGGAKVVDAAGGGAKVDSMTGAA